MFDLILKNGKIIDGTGSPWFYGDIGIAGGKITAIGKLEGAEADQVYDVGGRYISPGFIDIHTHSDRMLEAYPLSESRILQGVTTEIGGNCGMSPFPVAEKYREDLKNYVGGEVSYCWEDAKGFLDHMESLGGSTNFGALTGHGSLRLAVMGYSTEKATLEQLAAMEKLAEESLKGGSLGITSGLIYPPGSYSDQEEMIYVLRALRECGGFYATHMRNEGKNLVQSVKEALAVAETAGVRLQISHHKETYKPLHKIAVHETTKLIEEARERGIDVCCDQYPYNASATVLSINIPNWGFEGGLDKLIQRLHDPETRKKLWQEMHDSYLGRWDTIHVSYLESEKNRWMCGKSIDEIANTLGKDQCDVVFDLVEEERNRVNEIHFGMCEEDIEFIMKKPYVMPGSDGEAYGLDFAGLPHPRNFGTFPRVLAHYCRDHQLFSLETAVQKMTSLPSSRIGLMDRGVIRCGAWADLVVFDFEELESTPTYEDPKRACKGIHQVFVNGVLTAQDGKHTGVKAGKVLRR
ncbi:MAG: D-aminoacylase [Firmicutes bacterium]|nr:D-aminoacylase [Bacillota bacterium]